MSDELRFEKAQNIPKEAGGQIERQSTNKMITLEDNWTIVTQDMSLGCQFEHMILITKTGCEVLTKRADESIPI